MLYSNLPESCCSTNLTNTSMRSTPNGALGDLLAPNFALMSNDRTVVIAIHHLPKDPRCEELCIEAARS